MRYKNIEPGQVVRFEDGGITPLEKALDDVIGTIAAAAMRYILACPDEIDRITAMPREEMLVATQSMARDMVTATRDVLFDPAEAVFTEALKTVIDMGEAQND